MLKYASLDKQGVIKDKWHCFHITLPLLSSFNIIAVYHMLKCDIPMDWWYIDCDITMDWWCTIVTSQWTGGAPL